MKLLRCDRQLEDGCRQLTRCQTALLASEHHLPLLLEREVEWGRVWVTELQGEGGPGHSRAPPPGLSFSPTSLKHVTTFYIKGIWRIQSYTLLQLNQIYMWFHQIAPEVKSYKVIDF